MECLNEKCIYSFVYAFGFISLCQRFDFDWVGPDLEY